MLRRIANKVRAAFFHSDKPMERWSRNKLAEVKSYLEEKDPHIWSREDHHLSAEFVIQRYLPSDEVRTQRQYETTLRNLKAKIDRNIDCSDVPEEQIKEDPEFAVWLKYHLGTKVDRHEIVQLLSYFDDEGNNFEKIKALRTFNRWLEQKDSYFIDDDLLNAIRSTYSAWLTTEKMELLDMNEIKIFQCDIGNIPVQLLAYFSYPNAVPQISITPYAESQQKFRIDFSVSLVDLLSPDSTIRKAIHEFTARGYPDRLIGFDDQEQDFQLFSENL